MSWPFAATALLLTVVSFPDFRDRADAGCFWTDALLPYVGCQNLRNDAFWSFVLTLPLIWLIFMPFVALGSLLGIVHGQPVAVVGLAAFGLWLFSVWQLLTFSVAAARQWTNIA